MALTSQQKLDFVLKMTKHALEKVEHFDSGGIAGGLGSVLGTNNNFTAAAPTINPGVNNTMIGQAYTGNQAALGAATNQTNAVTPGVSQGVGTQNTLTQQLEQEATGQGPNAAQAALNLNTGQNINQAAALAAGVRGAGTNAGLIASNAANTGAQTQQTAAGQEALVQSQQALNAQAQLQNLAAQQIGQGQTAVNAENQVQQGEQGILENANEAANTANVQAISNQNATNAQTQIAQQQINQNVLGGLGKAVGNIGATVAKIPVTFAEGGEVHKNPHHKMIAEIYHPHLMGKHDMGQSMKSGGQVPGKPMVDHDAYKNDTVKAKLTPGEVVIDLDTLHDKGPIGQMARALAAHLEKKKMKKAS